MKKKVLLLLLISWGMNMIFAQGENDNWYFGNKAAVNFSGTTPISLANNNMYTIEACGSVSDSSGNLLFYTDGMSIWNSNHQVMPNGSGLGGHFSSQQLAILKHPGNANQYFVFNTGYNGGGPNIISYSIVDMTLQGGLGDVVNNLKNIPVTDNLGGNFQSEAITVVPTSENKFWILMPRNQTLYTYLVDSMGFHNGTPVMSNLNFPTNLGTNMRHFGIKASQRLCDKKFSNYVCISLWHDNYQPGYQNKVYSFDNTSGQITGDYSLEINSLQAYLPEFNKYGSVLFLGYNLLYAVNLESSTPSNVIYSQIYDFGGTACSAIQRNKNNDIYISQMSSYYLGKIINPDIYSPSNMGVNMQNLLLGNNMFGQRANHGLPQLIETVRNGNTQYCSSELECLPDLTLFSPETNTDYTHKAITITTKDKYYVDAGNGKITLSGGKSVTMLPNTFIKDGSDFLAHIQDCKIKSKTEQNRQGGVKMVLNLDGKVSSNAVDNEVTIYPNPATDLLSIKSNIKVDQVSVYDISGKKVNVLLNNNKVDVRNLPGGAYIINIETKDGKTTKKFIKK